MGLILGLLFGFVAGWIVTAAGMLTIGEMMAVSQREGAFAMASIFVMGPVGGVVGAVACGWLMRLRDSR